MPIICHFRDSQSASGHEFVSYKKHYSKYWTYLHLLLLRGIWGEAFYHIYSRRLGESIIMNQERQSDLSAWLPHVWLCPKCVFCVYWGWLIAVCCVSYARICTIVFRTTRSTTFSTTSRLDINTWQSELLSLSILRFDDLVVVYYYCFIYQIISILMVNYSDLLDGNFYDKLCINFCWWLALFCSPLHIT